MLRSLFRIPRIWIAMIRLCRAVKRRTLRECSPLRVGTNPYLPFYLENPTIWIEVRTDAEKVRLENEPAFMSDLRDLLDRVDYPAEERAGVRFDVASKEQVDKTCGGDWRYFYQ